MHAVFADVHKRVTAWVHLQVTAREDELEGKDLEHSRALRETAEVNEAYISELSASQQQLEADLEALQAQQQKKNAEVGRLEQQLAERGRQDQEMQQANKRLRGQVSETLTAAVDHLGTGLSLALNSSRLQRPAYVTCQYAHSG